MQPESAPHPLTLLPWLANGTLEGVERATVERHVADCAACQAELQLLRTVRGTLRAGPPVAAGEPGLQRLMRAVRATQAVRQPRWLVPAALAAGVVIAVQTVLLVQQRPAEPLYTPLSGPHTGVLQVVFMPDVSEAQLRALLRDAGVRIVDGPSAAGVYRLVPEDGADPAQVAQRLRMHSGIVRHVAPEP